MSTQNNIPAVGEIWPGQGGRLVGLHPLGGYAIAADDFLPQRYEFGVYGKRLNDYSDVDGKANTSKLVELGSPAAMAASIYTADGHSDFYLPSQREAALILASLGIVPDGPVMWASTPFGSNLAWALSFEFGDVCSWPRDSEFAVLPLRRFIP